MEIKERRNEKRGAKAEKYHQASLVVKKGNAISAASVREATDHNQWKQLCGKAQVFNVLEHTRE